MTYVLDCDGVILDTPKRKTEAFFYAAMEYGEHCAREMVRIHRNAGSVGRERRWEMFFREVLRRQPKPGELEERLAITTEYVLKSVELSQPLPGLEEWLSTLTDPIVVSGVEQSELQAILESKGLARYFSQIYGGDKHAILPKLIKQGKLALPATYLGDTLDDLIAARANNMDFILVTHASEWREGATYCESMGYRVVSDFTELVKDQQQPSFMIGS